MIFKNIIFALNNYIELIWLYVCVCLGEATRFTEFAIRHPILLLHLLMLVTCGCIGQLFIFLMVASFGPLACSVVTTTRKFFTVLFSVVFFGNVLSWRQWTGAIVVFTGLFADIFNAHITSLRRSAKKVAQHSDGKAKEKEGIANWSVVNRLRSFKDLL